MRSHDLCISSASKTVLMKTVLAKKPSSDLHCNASERCTSEILKREAEWDDRCKQEDGEPDWPLRVARGIKDCASGGRRDQHDRVIDGKEDAHPEYAHLGPHGLSCHCHDNTRRCHADQTEQHARAQTGPLDTKQQQRKGGACHTNGEDDISPTEAVLLGS